MAEKFSAEWARGILDTGTAKAKEFVDNPEQVQGLLDNLQEKMKGLPDTVATAFKNVPLMASMVKSYVTREYTEVSPKVIISLVSAFIYLAKQKDLIPDDIPVVGLADDIAVATIAMAINEPELKAYAEWRAQKEGAPIEVAAEPPAAAPAAEQPAPAPAVEAAPTAPDELDTIAVEPADDSIADEEPTEDFEL